IPRVVRNAVAANAIILLGYSLSSWDFRSLYWALFKPRDQGQTSASIQLELKDSERTYLEKYLREVKFEVYWGTIDDYIMELRQALEEM
ncbi:MAG: hypothetical protein AAF485_25030, partial [Chloroflexota bacterium]